MQKIEQVMRNGTLVEIWRDTTDYLVTHDVYENRFPTLEAAQAFAYANDSTVELEPTVIYPKK